MKSGFVSVVGRTNAGKSTLVNALIGEKIAIVSNKPQTTRYRIMGIKNEEDIQIVFTDTPGIHAPKTRLGDFMVNEANESLNDTDVALLVVEPVDNVGRSEEKLIEAGFEEHASFVIRLIQLKKINFSQLWRSIPRFLNLMPLSR